MKRSIRPAGVTAPAPSPTPEPVEYFPEPTKPDRFRTWTLNDKNYWQRPLRVGEPIVKGLVQGNRTVINAACGSDHSYDRIYIDVGYVFALTLGLAASFDTDGTAGKGDQ
jgi:hypothetical protein